MTAPNRERVEDFLFFEAELLDEWNLQEWVKLYREDAIYEVTSPASAAPVNSDPTQTLFLIADHIDRIRGRATRLLKKTAHAEYPHSKTRHLVTNVRYFKDNSGSKGDNEQINVRANFAVYRTKEDTTTVYMGEYRYRLVVAGDGFQIVQKRCILDLNSLYNQGRLTIIL